MGELDVLLCHIVNPEKNTILSRRSCDPLERTQKRQRIDDVLPVCLIFW